LLLDNFPQATAAIRAPAHGDGFEKNSRTHDENHGVPCDSPIT
jgi:hypothetical protein